jgi:hypothetical protein
MAIEQEVNSEIKRLKNLWSGRGASFQKWYKLIQLVNNLKQDNMESVISSDPRNGFDMAAWLLRPTTGKFLVDSDGLSIDEQKDSGRVEDYANLQVNRANRLTRGTLFGKFLDRLVKHMLATGWYALVSVPTQEGWIMQSWNPASIFPEYDSNGNLVAVARCYVTTYREGMRKAVTEGWKSPPIRTNGRGMWKIDQLYKLEGSEVRHYVIYDQRYVVSARALPWNTIPIYTAPVNGLPDDGSIMENEGWRSEVGVSLVGPMLDIQDNYNKMLTYMQQILRDVATPRFAEANAGSDIVKNPDDLYKRGAYFRHGMEEKIYAIETPALPPEMRGHQFDLRSMVQRGMFSDISFGNITQQVSAMLMSQVTASAERVLYPFHDGLMDALGSMATTNVRLMREYNIGVGELPKMNNHPWLEYKYDITVPGDFVNRATTARVLNPNFRISSLTLFDTLFPEVTNGMLEQGRLQTEDTLNNPLIRNILFVRELRVIAQDARRADDIEFAKTVEQAIQALMAQFGPQENVDQGSAISPSNLPTAVRELLGDLPSQ